jgi:AGZA family xanthine/uracil permease-like MFS transporter
MMRRALENYFDFEGLGTNWRTEAMAGLTTFATMAYIIFVNPAILGQAGMPAAGVTAATCLAAGFASILMGAFARYPIALAPGMGLNAYFAYTVVKGMGVAWQTALGAVFLSGLVFFALTLAGVRERLIRSLPVELYAAVGAGIGVFIAFIGLRNSGIVVSDAATSVKLGSMRSWPALIAMFGLVLTAALQARKVRPAVLVGIGSSTLLALATGVAKWEPRWTPLGEMASTILQLDVAAALRFGLAEILLVFLFVHLFDNLGTLVAVARQAGLMAPDGSVPRVRSILLADAMASMGGALLGTSPMVSYIESTAGIVAGGRSGVTAIATGLLFLAALAATPLAAVIPAAATAPALILVGAAMMGHAAGIDWRDPFVAVPAFVTIIAIPLTFSIANGIALGFTTFALVKLVGGRGREVSPLVYALAALFIGRFLYLSE